MQDSQKRLPEGPDIDRLLGELEAFCLENDSEQDDRQKKMLNLERPTAEFLDVLLRLGKRKLLLEIGTSNGYSTIWLARAMRDSGGELHTIERDAGKFAMARSNLERAGLQAVVTQHLGDATDVVQKLHRHFDCVFFDADRTSAARQLEILLPRLAPDVLLLADNADSHAPELEAYVATVRSLAEFRVTLLDVGKGLHMAYRDGLTCVG